MKKSNAAFRAVAIGLPHNRSLDLGHFFLRVSWPAFILWMGIAFLSINLFFSALYFLVPESIAGIHPGSFFDYFMFSVQTLSTVGYGAYTPANEYAHLVMMAESFVGIMFAAVVTGITFSKFARPTAKVLFSEKAIISDFEGVPTLMIRIGNARLNQIVEAGLKLVLLKNEITAEGLAFRRLYDLKLVRDMSPIFVMTWTVLHKITPDSPLYNLPPESFEKLDLGIIASLTGYDDTFSQTVHAIKTYPSDQVVKAKKFVDMLSVQEDGSRQLDYTKFHLIE